jgi:hypothetical protein
MTATGGEVWSSRRSETPEEAVSAGAELSGIFEAVDSLYAEGAISLPRVQRRSSLNGDDRRTEPYPLSHAVTRNLLVAIDHLHSLRAALLIANSLHTYAPFTLIRSSLEGSINALWLLKPEQRRERLTRHILACRADDRDQNTMAGCLDEPPATSREDWIERLIAECDLDRHRVRGGIPSFGSIVKTVDKETWCDGDNIGELGWRMCSGMAHGKEWATLDVLHRLFLREHRKGVAEVRLTAGMTDVATLAKLAHATLTEALNLFSNRSSPQY